MMFQKDIETLPREQIKAVQLERRKQTVKYCYQKLKPYPTLNTSPSQQRTTFVTTTHSDLVLFR